MNKTINLGLILIISTVIWGASCTQNADISKSSMNMNRMMNSNSINQNSMMNANMMNRNGMMNGNMMNNNGMMNGSNIGSMNDMNSSPDAAKQPYDLQFLDTMSLHHQGAVEMGKMVLLKSQNEELKKFAQKIIDDQTREIGQMKDWREKWYSGKPAAKNMRMPGMMDSMKMMSGDGMKMMEKMNGKDFDVHFLDMMIPHHEGAIKMSKETLEKSEKPEVKTLAGQIIKAQEAEIKMMQDWKTKWSK